LAFFVYGFAKSSKANITQGEVREFKKLAKILLAITDEHFEVMLQGGEIEELFYNWRHKNDEQL
jgi:hypothetical protein